MKIARDFGLCLGREYRQKGRWKEDRKEIKVGGMVGNIEMKIGWERNMQLLFDIVLFPQCFELKF